MFHGSSVPGCVFFRSSSSSSMAPDVWGSVVSPAGRLGPPHSSLLASLMPVSQPGSITPEGSTAPQGCAARTRVVA